MSDEWRVVVDLDDEEHGFTLGERLRSLDLDDEARERLGDRVIVTRDGAKLFLYATTEEQARLEGNGYGIPPILPEILGVTQAEDLAWVRPRLGLHPLKTWLDPVRLSNAQAKQLPRTFIYCVNSEITIFEPLANRLRVDSAWRFFELVTGHDAMITEPEQVFRLLLDLA
jgi:hypothetical protein